MEVAPSHAIPMLTTIDEARARRRSQSSATAATGIVSHHRVTWGSYGFSGNAPSPEREEMPEQQRAGHYHNTPRQPAAATRRVVAPVTRRRPVKTIAAPMARGGTALAAIDICIRQRGDPHPEKRSPSRGKHIRTNICEHRRDHRNRDPPVRVVRVLAAMRPRQTVANTVEVSQPRMLQRAKSNNASPAPSMTASTRMAAAGPLAARRSREVGDRAGWHCPVRRTITSTPRIIVRPRVE